MTDVNRENDALFFELLHKYANVTQISDLRSHERYPFPAALQIAPLYGKGLPHQTTFFAVAGHDLSQGGFSFLMVEKPWFKRLVAVFGEPTEPIYAQAEITHHRNVLYFPNTGLVEPFNDQQVVDNAGKVRPDVDQASARTRILVGCRFIGRLNDQ